MLANKGFVIEEDHGDPDRQETVRPHDPRLINEYFAKDLTFGSDDEDDETDGNSDLSFDLRAQKMVDLLPDGGVRKKVRTVYIGFEHSTCFNPHVLMSKYRNDLDSDPVFLYNVFLKCNPS